MSTPSVAHHAWQVVMSVLSEIISEIKEKYVP